MDQNERWKVAERKYKYFTKKTPVSFFLMPAVMIVMVCTSGDKIGCNIQNFVEEQEIFAARTT